MNAQQAEALAREIQGLIPASLSTQVAPVSGDRYGVKLVHKEHFLWIKSEEAWMAVQEYIHLLGYEDLLVSIYDSLKHEVSEAQRAEIRQRIKIIGLFTTDTDVPANW